MAEIKIEKPTPERLKALNVEDWSAWECEPSTFDWEYDADERAYVLEGKVKVTTEEGKDAEINKGDLVLFPKGLKCRWNVTERIRKVYRFE